ncbi:hypothetical protein A33Q_0834 [Indibacter alkaliphilus LW1]|uniref:DUF349 domain-containing protein n=1 Tax=Indibacter alkaliphilus (strain CCUG 57479 / KCTC 22604 / LW1) TaxID=1189612 RepID=S2DIV5_INDAL|nr:DUF349 domain-containing protein [Indibacter alkaliphilus]EOZ98979.1 hypothetical protein A33Q_0834 [Indibacter alkaliphilus LW1]
MDNDKEMSEKDKVTRTNSESVGEGKKDQMNEESEQAKKESPKAELTSDHQDGDESKSEIMEEENAEPKKEEGVNAETFESTELQEKVEETNPSNVSPVDSDKSTHDVSGEQSAVTQEQSEESTNDEEEEIEAVDYSHFNKKELLNALKELVATEKYSKIDSVVSEIKNHFDDIYNKEKDIALKDFLEKGGTTDDFQYRAEDEDRLFFAAYNDFREKKSNFLRDQERQKEKNLQAKNEILDRLRELVDGEETTHSISTIKSIQEEWKKIGPVPGSQNRSLWASYNALMDRFYDNRSIYFELKELDRKKNLEQKLEICEKAESLIKLDDLKEAIKILNDLHEEFKHIGPVPRDEQEALWQRFKSASDAVYERRKEFYDSQKEVFKDNLIKKEALIEKLSSFKDFTTSKIKEWNTKTKEVLAIQKEWEATGPVPREAGKEVNKKFWGHFKQFFHNKNQFFKELDDIRLTNKKKAEELISAAEALMESTDWQETSGKLINLQQEWKKIGPTPEKVRDELYRKFKHACDTFFDNRRDANKQVNKEFEDNLKLKETLCEKIRSESEGENLSEESLEKLITEFNAIGFVPRKNMKEIIAKFNEAVDAYVNKLGVAGGQKEEFLFRLNLNKLQADPNANRVLNKKEHGIRKQIADLENNITLWKNNLEFFAASKTADKLKDQFDEKINKAEKEIDKLKKKLSIIREF